MTIQEYSRILRRRGWIILVAVVLAAAAAFAISALQRELYQATVDVSTVPARPDWGLGNISKDLMRNFAANIHTPEVAQKVIDRAQLDMNPYVLLSNLQVEPDASTFTVKIQARDRDGEVAKLIALTLADEFVEERTAYYAQQDKRDRIEVKIRSRAIGYEQIRPKPLMNAVAGAVLGLLFGIAVVLALTWMEADRLRTPAATERALSVPVLGAIPDLSGTKEVTREAPQPGQISVPKAASG
jgi:capsular polysaccharide biosynthesis protein